MHRAFFVSLAFLLALATPAAAEVDYTPGGSPVITTYVCLDDLQKDHPTLDDGDTITFKDDDATLEAEFTLGDNGTLSFTSGTPGPLAISAAPNSTTRLLCATGNATITWASEVTFSGFNSTDSGGVAFVGGNLMGGIAGSSFNNNTGSLGGAVFVNDNFSGGISKSNFSNNSANGDIGSGKGGAVCVLKDFAGGITGSEFNSNSSEWEGGAVFVRGSLGEGITGSKFDGNKATNGSGGAVYVGQNLTGGISDSEFNNNGTATGFGGAVYVKENLTDGISNSTFSNNSAYWNGGAVAVGGNLGGGITGSSFSGNSVGSFGGAVYVRDNFTGGISASTFSNNIANDQGGAVYVGDNLGGGITGSTFSGNKLTNGTGAAVYVGKDLTGGITDSEFEGNIATNDNGGAVYVAGNLTDGITDSTFSNNRATNGGSGGAVFVDGNLTGGITNSTFSNNSAYRNGGAVYISNDLTGGITGSKFEGNNATNDNGGAVYISNDLTGGIMGSTFSNNSAGAFGGAVYVDGGLNGDIANSTFNNNSAGWSGGAVYVWNGLTGGITGSTFSNNSADGSGGAVFVLGNIGGGVSGSTFSDNTATDNGGAVRVDGNLSGGVSGSTFSGNTAGNSGGALYAMGNVDLSGAGASFTGNRALGIAGDDASGRGGAIFYDGGQNPGSPAKTFIISATPGAPIVFSGNTHNPGQTGEVPNSIYFGNSWPSGQDSQVNAIFNVAEGGALNMLDSMASQQDDFTSAGMTLSNLALNIDKTGPGTWVLAGHSHMQSATNWVVSEGVLHLVADEGGRPAYIELANTSNAMNVTDYASFTLKSGASLLLEPTEEPHQISGQSITLASGSSVALAGFQYGPKLDTGRRQVLALNAPALSNQSGVPQSKGTITVGVYKYSYNNLAWEGDNALFVNLEPFQPDPGPGPDPRPDPILSGAPSITGASHIASLNPAFNIFSYHAKGLFGWNNLPYQEFASSTPRQYAYADNLVVSDVGYVSGNQPQYLNRLWVTPNYVNTNQSGGGGNAGYLLQTPGFALGYDRQLNEDAFVGLGVSVSWPDYEDNTTSINATDITFALYGGVKLAYALELDGHVGFGFTRYDQDRQVETERYGQKYNGNNFFAGLGVGRPFALGHGFSLRPGAAYDFIHLNIDGFNEGAGTYALKSEDYSQNLHRLKVGLDLSWTEASSGLVIGGEVYYLGVYGDRVAETTGHYVADPINGFTMIGNGLDRDNLGLGLRVTLPVGERWELGAGYNVLFGSDTVSQQGLLSAVYKF